MRNEILTIQTSRYWRLLSFYWGLRRRLRRLFGARIDRVLFAASKGLRVGEGLLDDAQGAALYVFSRVLAVRPILAHLERLAGGSASS